MIKRFIALTLWLIVGASSVNAVVNSPAVTHTAANYVQCANGRVGPACHEGQELNNANEEIYDFMSFDNGSGTTRAGWTWDENASSFGEEGWFLDINASGPHGGGDTYSIGQTRSFNKTASGGDTAQNSRALIDTVDFAPTKNTGGSIKIYDPNNLNTNRASWWMWYDGKPLTDRNVTDQDTDRMSFYIKTTGMDALDPDDISPNNIHVGTYLCWPFEGEGGGCPTEGPGNQHYYHWLAINSGGWIHAILDQMPQHRRGRANGQPQVLNNPVFASDGKNYFEQINQFYMEIAQLQSTANTLSIDEITFYSTSDTVEPNQNDESISSIWVGYFPDAEYWEIGWMDNSFVTYDSYTFSTFEVRWSLSPITNANWSSATPLPLQYYSGVGYTSQSATNVMRRPSPNKRTGWNRFTISDSLLTNATKVYFAVKDVSVSGENQGTIFPYNLGHDARDSVSSYIKTIDYNWSAN